MPLSYKGVASDLKLPCNISFYSQVPYQDLPTFNVKRRSCIPASTLSTLKRCRSNPQLHHLLENFPSDGSQRLVADDSVLAKRSDRRMNRRRTELGIVTEFTVDGLFGSRSPRSLSISSSGSGQSEHSSLSEILIVTVILYFHHR